MENRAANEGLNGMDAASVIRKGEHGEVGHSAKLLGDGAREPVVGEVKVCVASTFNRSRRTWVFK